MENWEAYKECRLCPRNCGLDRSKGKGWCGSTAKLMVARAALHFWEEPIISGNKGSGAVFFSGCNLHCIFCQNREIALGDLGQEIDKERLAEIFLELQDQGANNINLVTAVTYLPHVVWALDRAKKGGLHIPVVYNSGGYEKVESLKRLEGLVDIYLPDHKYRTASLAKALSGAEDYPLVAGEALAEMFRQQPKAEVKEEGDQLLMKRGVMVRHLLLPGQLHDGKLVLRYLYEHYGNEIYYSLMSQYTPVEAVKSDPLLGHRISEESYEAYLDFARRLGIQHGFQQEREVAKESFIPHFDGTGVLKH